MALSGCGGWGGREREKWRWRRMARSGLYSLFLNRGWIVGRMNGWIVDRWIDEWMDGWIPRVERELHKPR